MDKELIEQARKIPYQFWYEINGLIEKAQSPETIERLRWIMREKELLEQLTA